VLHCAPLVLPITAEPIADGAVAIAGDRIAAVGPRADLLSADGDAKVREWPGILLPGLVNAHAHIEYSDFADMAGNGKAFPEWIRGVTERRATFTAAMWLESSRRGVHQMLSTGTTCVADIVTHGPALTAVAAAGMAGVSYVEMVGVDEARWPAALDTLEGHLATAPAGRNVGISPHAPFTLGTEVLRRLGALARERGLRLHVHVAESAAECEFVRTGGGPFGLTVAGFELALELRGVGCGLSPTAYVDSVDLLGPDVHVAHGIHVDAADRALLRQRGSAVALCPRSNAILSAGDAPVADYLAEGNPIGVGTDSLASSPSLDLLDELRALRDLAEKQGAPYAGLSRRLVEVATVGGAAAMGLDDVGRLEPGARADLAVVEVDPSGDPYEALVGSGAGHCIATVLGGRIVHRRH
jgi:cytosine/adenosine deaminase-related metal-dependent hydrolase